MRELDGFCEDRRLDNPLSKQEMHDYMREFYRDHSDEIVRSRDDDELEERLQTEFQQGLVDRMMDKLPDLPPDQRQEVARDLEPILQILLKQHWKQSVEIAKKLKTLDTEMASIDAELKRQTGASQAKIEALNSRKKELEAQRESLVAEQQSLQDEITELRDDKSVVLEVLHETVEPHSPVERPEDVAPPSPPKNTASTVEASDGCIMDFDDDLDFTRELEAMKLAQQQVQVRDEVRPPTLG
jgi:chromosome segregation ATPase